MNEGNVAKPIRSEKERAMDKLEADKEKKNVLTEKQKRAIGDQEELISIKDGLSIRQVVDVNKKFVW